MKILAVDPSVLHCGWAYMEDIAVPRGGISLHASGTIVSPEEYKTATLVQRIGFVLSDLTTVECDVDKIIIEEPEPWGAYKSMASSRSGSLQMLTLLTGALVGWGIGQSYSTSVELVKVSKWKGQLPKHVTQARMEKKYQRKFATNDEADAVGLGDWWLMQYLKKGDAK